MSEPPLNAALPLGVNLAGYLDATAGIGEAARHVATALRAAGVAVAPIVLAGDAPRSLDAAGDLGAAADATHATTIICANPEGIEGARDQIGAEALAGRHVVGMWWWEVDALPPRWLRAFDVVDEVWVGSRFVADALAAVSPVPVVHVPLAVSEPQASDAGRAELGLPDGFLFGFVYDYASIAARKNPLGLIAAYDRAVPASERERVRLVLKSLGGDGRWAAEHAEVVAAAAACDGVVVVDGHMAAGDKNALLRELDCYVSLHRSEGFGLTIAEAMLLGTPVIATDYGGSRDFVTPFNARPVDYRLVSIGPGHDPYPATGTWAEPDLAHAAKRMRAAWERPERLRERADRARADMLAAHAPQVAGQRMADRLARIATAPHDGAGRLTALDLDGIRERLSREPRPGDAGADAGPRAALRDAALRAMRPYTAHQRLLDEEILRALQSLDERVRGLAQGQQSL
ncbi:MAG: hypothetical protein QOJ89_387, partial [bacterium]